MSRCSWKSLPLKVEKIPSYGTLTWNTVDDLEDGDDEEPREQPKRELEDDDDNEGRPRKRTRTADLDAVDRRHGRVRSDAPANDKDDLRADDKPQARCTRPAKAKGKRPAVLMDSDASRSPIGVATTDVIGWRPSTSGLMSTGRSGGSGSHLAVLRHRAFIVPPSRFARSAGL